MQATYRSFECPDWIASARLYRRFCGIHYVMRAEINRLLLLGPLPSENDASVDPLRLVEAELKAVVKPFRDDEARALVTLFGPDGCFGIAWSFLHLIETAPGWPIADCLTNLENEWVISLRDRAVRGGLL